MTDVRGIRITMEAAGLRASTEVQSMDQVGQAVPEVRRQLEREIERRDDPYADMTHRCERCEGLFRMTRDGEPVTEPVPCPYCANATGHYRGGKR